MRELTKRQREVLNEYLKTMNKAETARTFGVCHAAIRKTLKQIEAKGLAPWQTPAVTPDHLSMVKTTVQYDRNGIPTQEWKRLIPNAQQMQEFVEGLCAEVKGKGKIKARKARKSDNADLIAEISIFDFHAGMLADAEETGGKDWDCAIAERLLMETIAKLISRFDHPSKIIVSFGGDMMHTNGRIPTTERSGNIMDVDSRYSKVIQIIRRVCINTIELAAKVAPEVDVIVVRGNHDPDGSDWLALVLESFYHGSSGVNVLLQRTDRKHIVFGDNLLVWAHGDGIALKRWGEIIPNEFREKWGSTKFCHVKTGHIHHRRGKKTSVITQNDEGWVEQGGVLAESLPASCFRDAYHAAHGFFGQLVGIAGFEYHKRYGMWSRFYQPMEEE